MGREINFEGALKLIREHKLGGIYVSQTGYKVDEFLKKLRETADYPILMFINAEAVGTLPFDLKFHKKETSSID